MVLLFLAVCFTYKSNISCKLGAISKIVTIIEGTMPNVCEGVGKGRKGCHRRTIREGTFPNVCEGVGKGMNCHQLILALECAVWYVCHPLGDGELCYVVRHDPRPRVNVMCHVCCELLMGS